MLAWDHWVFLPQTLAFSVRLVADWSLHHPSMCTAFLWFMFVYSTRHSVHSLDQYPQFNTTYRSHDLVFASPTASQDSCLYSRSVPRSCEGAENLGI